MSKAAQVLGSAMLIHGIYSLRELNLAATLTQASVPKDMVIEAIIGAILIISTVFWNLVLKPVRISDALAEEESTGKNRFLHLETRARFQDIRAKRAQHLQWKQSQ